jgi:hypothetical protein
VSVCRRRRSFNPLALKRVHDYDVVGVVLLRFTPFVKTPWSCLCEWVKVMISAFRYTGRKRSAADTPIEDAEESRLDSALLQASSLTELTSTQSPFYDVVSLRSSVHLSRTCNA